VLDACDLFLPALIISITRDVCGVQLELNRIELNRIN